MEKKNNKLTAYDIYLEWKDDNTPTDWGWVNRLLRQNGKKWFRQNCLEMARQYADSTTAKQTLGRAATMIYEYLV